MTRAFAPMLAAAAFAATFFAAPAARAQTVTDLGTAGSETARAFGTSGGTQVGIGYGEYSGDSRALLWKGTAASVVDLTPSGFSGTNAYGVSGDAQVGYGAPANATGYHALLWKGTAASFVDLNPSGYSASFGYAVSGDAQVGYGYGPHGQHALLWHGTAASAVNLDPTGFHGVFGTGVSGDAQVGYGITSGGNHALLWHGTAASYVDLNPDGFTNTEASAVEGDTQVGNGSGPSIGGTNHPHALLWHGTAGSVVDLNPDGFTGSYATGVSGTAQVGYGDFYNDDVNGVDFVSHALLWHGTAASYVDLGAYLPDGYNTTSEAYGIDENGDIVGSGTGSKGTHAFLWHGMFAPKPFLNDLSPATRTANRGAFTLTAHGTGFTSKSVVNWNGAPQTTTFVNSTTLTAAIPASLTASTGTAKITVVTPGLATSGSLTFIIYPDAHIGVIVTDLNPAGFSYSYATGVSGNVQVGYQSASYLDNQALLWHGTAKSALDLNPQGVKETFATGVSGNVQVGYKIAEDNGYRALLWTGSAASAVDLTPSGFDYSQAFGVSGNAQVGQVVKEESDGDEGYIDYYYAVLWHGTAGSAVDISPAGVIQPIALGVSDSAQVGSGYVKDATGYYQKNAILWHGTADSAVNLAPSGVSTSEALGVSGDVQVGYGDNHAILWKGTAVSAIDLTPTNISGYTSSRAQAVSGSIAVGYASGTATGHPPSAPSDYYYNHALLWRGTASSAIDLNDYLPEDFNTSSSASGIDGNDDYVDVVGSASSQTFTTHAFLWHIMLVGKPAVTSLSPSYRTAGSAAFPLTVNGTNFTPRTIVKWNGAEQATTFVSSTKLTVTIAAALIAPAGTDTVTVTTPHVATSGGQTFTVYPRPVLTSLSPVSKPASSYAFTLTVSGTSFLSSSLVKWNGEELTTTYVSATKLTAFVSASRLHTAGTEQITVTTPHVATSGSKAFTITP